MYICDFFLFHIEIEGKGGWIIGGGPPLSNYWGGGVSPPLAPLFLRLCGILKYSKKEKKYKSHQRLTNHSAAIGTVVFATCVWSPTIHQLPITSALVTAIVNCHVRGKLKFISWSPTGNVMTDLRCVAATSFPFNAILSGVRMKE